MWVRIEDRKPNKWGGHYVFSSLSSHPFIASWNGDELGFTDSDGEKFLPIYNSIIYWYDFSFVKNPVQ